MEALSTSSKIAQLKAQFTAEATLKRFDFLDIPTPRQQAAAIQHIPPRKQHATQPHKEKKSGGGSSSSAHRATARPRRRVSGSGGGGVHSEKHQAVEHSGSDEREHVVHHEDHHFPSSSEFDAQRASPPHSCTLHRSYGGHHHRRTRPTTTATAAATAAFATPPSIPRASRSRPWDGSQTEHSFLKAEFRPAGFTHREDSAETLASPSPPASVPRRRRSGGLRQSPPRQRKDEVVSLPSKFESMSRPTTVFKLPELGGSTTFQSPDAGDSVAETLPKYLLDVPETTDLLNLVPESSFQAVQSESSFQRLRTHLTTKKEISWKTISDCSYLFDSQGNQLRMDAFTPYASLPASFPDTVGAAVPSTRIPTQYHMFRMPPSDHSVQFQVRDGFNEKQKVRYRIFPCSKPAGRYEVVLLFRTLHAMLSDRQHAFVQEDRLELYSRSEYYTAFREEFAIWDVIFSELVRQVYVHCSERGHLLELVRTRVVEFVEQSQRWWKLRENRLTINANQSFLEFDTEHKVQWMQQEVDGLKLEVSTWRGRCRRMENDDRDFKLWKANRKQEIHDTVGAWGLYFFLWCWSRTSLIARPKLRRREPSPGVEEDLRAPSQMSSVSSVDIVAEKRAMQRFQSFSGADPTCALAELVHGFAPAIRRKLSVVLYDFEKEELEEQQKQPEEAPNAEAADGEGAAAAAEQTEASGDSVGAEHGGENASEQQQEEPVNDAPTSADDAIDSEADHMLGMRLFDAQKQAQKHLETITSLQAELGAANLAHREEIMKLQSLKDAQIFRLEKQQKQTEATSAATQKRLQGEIDELRAWSARTAAEHREHEQQSLIEQSERFAAQLESVQRKADLQLEELKSTLNKLRGDYEEDLMQGDEDVSLHLRQNLGKASVQTEKARELIKSEVERRVDVEKEHRPAPLPSPALSREAVPPAAILVPQLCVNAPPPAPVKKSARTVSTEDKETQTDAVPSPPPVKSSSQAEPGSAVRAQSLFVSVPESSVLEEADEDDLTKTGSDDPHKLGAHPRTKRVASLAVAATTVAQSPQFNASRRMRAVVQTNAMLRNLSLPSKRVGAKIVPKSWAQLSYDGVVMRALKFTVKAVAELIVERAGNLSDSVLEVDKWVYLVYMKKFGLPKIAEKKVAELFFSVAKLGNADVRLGFFADCVGIREPDGVPAYHGGLFDVITFLLLQLAGSFELDARQVKRAVSLADALSSVGHVYVKRAVSLADALSHVYVALSRASEVLTKVVHETLATADDSAAAATADHSSSLPVLHDILTQLNTRIDERERVTVNDVIAVASGPINTRLFDEDRRKAEVMYTIFQAGDTNGDGELDLDEFVPIARHFNPDLPYETIQHLYDTTLASVDTITADTFVELIKAMGLKASELSAENLPVFDHNGPPSTGSSRAPVDVDSTDDVSTNGGSPGSADLTPASSPDGANSEDEGQ